MRIQLFEEHNAKKNAFLLFLITLLFCFIGGHLRFPQELSVLAGQRDCHWRYRP